MRKKKLPQPWFRPGRNLWYVTIDGTQHNLGPDEQRAWDEYERLLRAPKPPKRPPPIGPDALVTLIDRFLQWCQEHRRTKTYEWYRRFLQLFVDTIDKRMTVTEFKPYHLDECLAKFPHWSSGGKHNMARAVQRVFRWANRKGYIDRSPLTDYEKPRPGKRRVVVSPEEFQRILSFTRDRTFRDLLTVVWETGCRPQEILRVRGCHLDLANQRWILPIEESKGEIAPRVVYLTDAALKIVKRLYEQHRQGILFRNSCGRPWTTESVNCRFCALQQRMGRAELKRCGLSVDEREVTAKAAQLKPLIGGPTGRRKTESELRHEARRKLTHKLAAQYAPKYCLYHLRHSWLDRKLKSGTDALTCALLMGHRDPSMLARVYQHLSQSPEYLLREARRNPA